MSGVWILCSQRVLRHTLVPSLVRLLALLNLKRSCIERQSCFLVTCSASESSARRMLCEPKSMNYSLSYPSVVPGQEWSTSDRAQAWECLLPNRRVLEGPRQPRRREWHFSRSPQPSWLDFGWSAESRRASSYLGDAEISNIKCQA